MKNAFNSRKLQTLSPSLAPTLSPVYPANFVTNNLTSSINSFPDAFKYADSTGNPIIINSLANGLTCSAPNVMNITKSVIIDLAGNNFNLYNKMPNPLYGITSFKSTQTNLLFESSVQNGSFALSRSYAINNYGSGLLNININDKVNFTIGYGCKIENFLNGSIIINTASNSLLNMIYGGLYNSGEGLVQANFLDKAIFNISSYSGMINVNSGSFNINLKNQSMLYLSNSYCSNFGSGAFSIIASDKSITQINALQGISFYFSGVKLLIKDNATFAFDMNGVPGQGTIFTMMPGTTFEAEVGAGSLPMKMSSWPVNYGNIFKPTNVTINGVILNIKSNQTLESLIGNRYPIFSKTDNNFTASINFAESKFKDIPFNSTFKPYVINYEPNSFYIVNVSVSFPFTSAPTWAPSLSLTLVPSLAPSKLPSAVPSFEPSKLPSAEPSNLPTSQPSNLPSKAPSKTPSALPTSEPSATPTLELSIPPSFEPTLVPTLEPTPGFILASKLKAKCTPAKDMNNCKPVMDHFNANATITEEGTVFKGYTFASCLSSTNCTLNTQPKNSTSVKKLYPGNQKPNNNYTMPSGVFCDKEISKEFVLIEAHLIDGLIPSPVVGSYFQLNYTALLSFKTVFRCYSKPLCPGKFIMNNSEIRNMNEVSYDNSARCDSDFSNTTSSNFLRIGESEERIKEGAEAVNVQSFEDQGVAQNSLKAHITNAIAYFASAAASLAGVITGIDIGITQGGDSTQNQHNFDEDSTESLSNAAIAAATVTVPVVTVCGVLAIYKAGKFLGFWGSVNNEPAPAPDIESNVVGERGFNNYEE